MNHQRRGNCQEGRDRPKKSLSSNSLTGYFRATVATIASFVSDGLKTDETCRFENRVLAGGSKTPSEGCSDGGVGLDWFSVQGGLI